MSRLIVIALLVINLGLLGYDAMRVAPAADANADSKGHPPPQPVDPERWADAPRIQLMTEMPEPAAAIDSSRQCWSAGPFETLATRDAVRAEITGFADVITDRESEALVELGYWVTLPGYASMADAASGMQELSRAGLHDIAVVSDDESGDYRVSLGYFLQEANARRRRDQLRELGYEAETRLQRESQPRYWLDFERAIPSDEVVATGPAIPPSELGRPIPCSAVDDEVGDEVVEREALADFG